MIARACGNPVNSSPLSFETATEISLSNDTVHSDHFTCI